MSWLSSSSCCARRSSAACCSGVSCSNSVSSICSPLCRPCQRQTGNKGLFLAFRPNFSSPTRYARLTEPQGCHLPLIFLNIRGVFEQNTTTWLQTAVADVFSCKTASFYGLCERDERPADLRGRFRCTNWNPETPQKRAVWLEVHIHTLDSSFDQCLCGSIWQ